MKRSNEQYFHLFSLMLIMAFAAFMTHYLLLASLIHPVLFNLADIYASTFHHDIGAHVYYHSDKKAWVLTNQLFQAKTDFINGQVAPKGFFIEGETIVPLSGELFLTFGLPIVWVLIICLTKHKVVSVICGTLVQLCFCLMTTCLHITFTLLNGIARDADAMNLMIFTPDNTIKHAEVSTTTLMILKPLYEGFMMMSLIGAPILITYLLLIYNKQLINNEVVS